VVVGRADGMGDGGGRQLHVADRSSRKNRDERSLWLSERDRDEGVVWRKL
jgi:hypothetical protein